MATIYVTEVATYLRCRRRWDLTSFNRQNLTRLGPPTPAFHLGSAIHHALDAQLRGEDPFTALEAYFADEEARAQAAYVAVVGTVPSPSELKAAKDVRDLAFTLLTKYVARYGGGDVRANLIHPYVPLESEVSFRVPIPGTRGYLAGTFDALVRHKDRAGERWVLERKTFTNPPTVENLYVDTQLTLYCWAAELLFSEPVAGVLYDGIGKRIAKAPDGVFVRHKIEIPRASLERWSQDLPRIYREMASAKTPIVPSFGYLGDCWDCNVRDLCHAIQRGQDVERVMLGYHRGEGHRTVRALLRPTRTVRSLKKG